MTIPGLSQHASLLLFALVSVIGLVVLIARFKVNSFVALILASLFMGLASGMDLLEIANGFQNGVGKILAGIAMIVGLGTLLGKMLAESGGAEVVAQTLIRTMGERRLTWAMMLVAFTVGIPVWFAVGLVLLVPILFTVARETKTPLLVLGIPLAAGLSVTHGLVPPHPGPMVAIGALNADVGKTILYSLIIGLPTTIIAGPMCARWLAARHEIDLTGGPAAQLVAQSRRTNLPGFGLTVFTILLPVALMLSSTVAGVAFKQSAIVITSVKSQEQSRVEEELVFKKVTRDRSHAAEILKTIPATVSTGLTTATAEGIARNLQAAGAVVTIRRPWYQKWIEFVGQPLVAMTVAFLFSCWSFGFARGFNREQVLKFSNDCVGPVAGTLLIVGAGGGFNGVLLASGVGDAIKTMVADMPVSPLILGWLAAALIRVATGSATVAITAAAGMLAPIVAVKPGTNLELLVLSMGAGSLTLSHVNDGGFWFVKEYFNLTVTQTLKTWTVMETVISVVALVLVLMLDLIV